MLLKVSVVITGGVILITKFAFLSPKEAESISSNYPSANTGVSITLKAERRNSTDKITLVAYFTIVLRVLIVIYFVSNLDDKDFIAKSKSTVCPNFYCIVSTIQNIIIFVVIDGIYL